MTPHTPRSQCPFIITNIIQLYYPQVKLTDNLTWFKKKKKHDFKKQIRASQVIQWLRICLPMQGTWIRKDSTCHWATNPVYHNYWTHILEPESFNYGAHKPQLLKLARLEPVLTRKATAVKSPSTAMKTQVQSLGSEDPGEGNGRLQSMGSQWVNFLLSYYIPE